MDYINITVWYGILYKRDGFSITGRKDVLPTKGLVRKVLNFISLFFVKGGKNKCIKRTVDVIGASGNAFIKKALVGI